MNLAIARGQYYTGSLYDIPFVASVCWMIWAALLARGLKPVSESAPSLPLANAVARRGWRCWRCFPSADGILVMVSRHGPAPPAAVPAAGYAGGDAGAGLVSCFCGSVLMDRELVRLLEESRASLENMKRLQTELVQREKLASLAQLVSGAAHEINNPLAAILGYSELLAAQPGLESGTGEPWRARSGSRPGGRGSWFPAC